MKHNFCTDCKYYQKDSTGNWSFAEFDLCTHPQNIERKNKVSHTGIEFIEELVYCDKLNSKANCKKWERKPIELTFWQKIKLFIDVYFGTAWKLPLDEQDIEYGCMRIGRKSKKGKKA
jgi:hypothetical protein